MSSILLTNISKFFVSVNIKYQWKKKKSDLNNKKKRVPNELEIDWFFLKKKFHSYWETNENEVYYRFVALHSWTAETVWEHLSILLSESKNVFM